jgi:hypothetical protein
MVKPNNTPIKKDILKITPILSPHKNYCLIEYCHLRSTMNVLDIYCCLNSVSFSFLEKLDSIEINNIDHSKEFYSIIKKLGWL